MAPVTDASEVRWRPLLGVRRIVIFLALACLLGAALVVISYHWLDRPIAEFASSTANHRPHSGMLANFIKGPNPLVGLAWCLLVGSAVWGLVKPVSFWPKLAFIAGSCTLVVDAFKNDLKILFGRTWPDSWAGQHPTFLQDGAYGFHLFKHGAAYQSFPSGHMAVACAFLTVLALYLPPWRPLIIPAAIAIGVALVLGNYHFLSDVIAGALVGAATGCLGACAIEQTVANWRND